MNKWILKAVVQKIISLLPFSNKINYIFQKHVTGRINFSDEFFYDRLGHFRDHLKSFEKYSQNTIPESCLEIGTGWYPVVPVGFFLAGSDKIFSVDRSLNTSKARVKITLQNFVKAHNSGKLNNYINILPERVEIIENILFQYSKYTLIEILQKLNIIYLIENAGKLPLPENSIDIICSNNTFEHICSSDLILILKEFKRVMKNIGGVTSHFIDMTDHFAHFDKTISIYNFLRFSELQWKWIDNSVQPQNRLRIYDYKLLYSKLNIPVTVETFREGNLKELNIIPLNEKFSDKPLNETAISHCRLVTHMNNFA